MIPYEELAAALEGSTSKSASAGVAMHDSARQEDPTFTSSTAENTGELEIGEVLTDEEAS